jgi:hypothetical protein
MMQGADTPAAIVGSVVFFLFLLAGAQVARGARSVTLVAQKFHLSVAPKRPTEPAVEIVGRAQGVIAFVLSLMGISPITRFIVAGSELRLQRTSVLGESAHYIPLRSISSLSGGVKKPITTLVVGTFIIVLGVGSSIASRSWIPIVISFVLAIICLIYYALSKRFFLAVYPHGGPGIQLMFAPNVLEGVSINSEQTLAVIAVIRDLILAKGEEAPLALTAAVESADFERPHQGQPQTWSEMKPEEFEPLEVEPLEVETIDVEELANNLYSSARALAQSGEQQKAIAALKDILRRYPTTEAAKKARRNLERAGAM